MTRHFVPGRDKPHVMRSRFLGGWTVHQGFWCAQGTTVREAWAAWERLTNNTYAQRIDARVGALGRFGGGRYNSQDPYVRRYSNDPFDGWFR